MMKNKIIVHVFCYYIDNYNMPTITNKNGYTYYLLKFNFNTFI